MLQMEPSIKDTKVGSDVAGKVIRTPEELVAARLEAKMSRETLAARLHVTPSKLAALETGGWQSLPSLAFARALARSAARELNADASGLVSAIGGFAQPSNLDGLVYPAPARPFATSSIFRVSGMASRTDGHNFRRLIVPIAAIGAISFVAMAIVLSGPGEQFGAGDGQSRIVKVPIPGASPAAGGVQAGTPQSSGMVKVSIPGMGTRPAIRPANIAASAPQGHVKKVAVSSGQLSAGLAVKQSAEEAGGLTFPVQMPDSEPIEVTFTKPAWVDIRHKDGEKLLFGEQKANKSVVLNAVTPVQVVIGNPEGVKMRFRGETVDLSKRTRKGVSRFELK